MTHSIYIRRRSKIDLPTRGETALPLNYITSVMANLESLGYTFSEPLMEACRGLTLEELTLLYQELVTDLSRAAGAHHKFRPMYPNFPDQVMAMDESELYINAILHYLTDGKWQPFTKKRIRLPLLDKTVDPKVIDLGTTEEFESLFGQVAASNGSLSEQDREDLSWFVATYGDGIGRLLPPSIPQKENVAWLTGLLMNHTSQAEEFVSRYVKTATDVLRLAVALSEGDTSLAKNTKFRTFSRPERRLLLGLVNRHPSAVEDMLRWRHRWIRLGEKLHPEEFEKLYPNAGAAFRVVRDTLPIVTFNRQIESAVAHRSVNNAIHLLSSRPGDFARRLDYVLRIGNVADQESTTQAFAQVADRVSTPVLLQVMHHFRTRSTARELRVFFPKGNMAKAHAEEDRLIPISQEVCERAAGICELAVVKRFGALPSLGKVYVGEELSGYFVPTGVRSASKSFRTVGRGSRLPFRSGCKVLRFFVWWKNVANRTDIDLSAALFGGDFRFKDLVSYYNLKTLGGVHSGDIVDATNGASEFIDIDLELAATTDTRFIVMTLTSYTRQPFAELPECFSGWMAREHAGSGEIYEPTTVQDRLDITAQAQIAIPLIIDVIEGKVVWCDMSLRRHPDWDNHVHGNLSGISVTLQSLVGLNKPSIHDLFVLHAQAWGERVDSPEEADTVFSVENGTPFRHEEILSQYFA